MPMLQTDNCGTAVEDLRWNCVAEGTSSVEVLLLDIIYRNVLPPRLVVSRSEGHADFFAVSADRDVTTNERSRRSTDEVVARTTATATARADVGSGSVGTGITDFSKPDG